MLLSCTRGGACGRFPGALTTHVRTMTVGYIRARTQSPMVDCSDVLFKYHATTHASLLHERWPAGIILLYIRSGTIPELLVPVLGMLILGPGDPSPTAAELTGRRDKHNYPQHLPRPFRYCTQGCAAVEYGTGTGTGRSQDPWLSSPWSAAGAMVSSTTRLARGTWKNNEASTTTRSLSRKGELC